MTQRTYLLVNTNLVDTLFTANIMSNPGLEKEAISTLESLQLSLRQQTDRRTRFRNSF